MPDSVPAGTRVTDDAAPVAAPPVAAPPQALLPQALLPQAQRRAVRTLIPSQVLGSIGIGAAAGVGSLLAARIGGTDSLAGLGATATALGAALLALPMSRIMDARGRRLGLMFGYSTAVVGAVTIIVSAALPSFPLLMLGMLLFGAGNAANLQARYAAVDAAAPHQRSVALSAVVWASTIGAVAGPNLIDASDRAATSLGLPELGGIFSISAVAFALAGVVVFAGLRPDPLLTVRAVHATRSATAPRLSWQQAAAAIRSSPLAVIAVIAMSSANAVMIGVMGMTPVEMKHMGSDLHIIGLVISLHIAGMFAFSPLVGWLANVFGRLPIIVSGQLMMIAAFLVAGLAGSHSTPAMAVGLVLLGLGWSFSLIGGSTLLTESLPEAVRPRCQGLADLTMGLCGAAAAALSGVVVSQGSYGLLNGIALVLIVLALGGSTATRVRSRPAR